MDLTTLSEEQILALARDTKSLQARAKQISAQRMKEAKEAAEREAAQRKANVRAHSVDAMHKGRDTANARGRRATGVDWFDALPEDQQMLEVAKANLAAYGSIVAPRELQILTLDKQCPSCGKSKRVLEGFGLRTYKGGRIKPQVWCRECRKGSASSKKK